MPNKERKLMKYIIAACVPLLLVGCVEIINIIDMLAKIQQIGRPQNVRNLFVR
jgi:hypothetical protein